MSAVQIAPAPWKRDGFYIEAPGVDYYIATCAGPNATHIADRIVQRVNAHDGLVAALRGLQADPNDPRAHRVALDALAAAGAA